MKKVFIALLAIVLIGSLILGGCAKTTTTPTPTPTTPTTPAAPAKPTTPTTPAAPAAPATPTTPSAVKPITLVFSDHEATGSYWDTDIQGPWIAEIEKRTNGRVKVEAHYNSELVGLFDVYDAVLKGTVDIGKILPTMFADKFPMDGAVIFQPVNIRTWRAGQVWLDLYNTFPEMATQYKATPLLGLAPMPCAFFCTTKGKVITKLEDMKGLKAPGAGPAPESRQKAIGVIPVSVPPPECYMGFKTGTLDGIASALISLKDFGWTDVLPNAVKANMNGGPWSYVMNQKKWNSLPADIQKVFLDLRPWVTERDDYAQAKYENIAVTTFPKAYGTNITYLPQEELDKWAAADTKAMESYMAAEVESRGLPAKELTAEFLRLQKKYAADEYAYKFN